MKIFGLGLVIAVLLILLTAGCTTQKILCEPPNSIINNACCVDTNKNNVCDNKEDVSAASEEAPMQSQMQSKPAAPKENSDSKTFANTFASAWKAQDFAKLYTLFSEEYRASLPKEEFVWLSQKKNAALNVEDVRVYRVAGDVIEYDLITDDPRIKNSARGVVIWELDAYRHRPFNYFKSLSVTDVCGENSSCVVEYAKTFKKEDVCDLAGSQRVACRQSFGMKYTYDDERALCNEIPDYFDKAECIQNVSVKYGRPDACWDLSEDPQLFGCLGHVAALSRNPQLCWDYMKNFTFVGDKIKHAYCIRGYVEETNDYTVCKQMKHGGNIIVGAMEEECYKL
ncbi:hypothetical protein HZB03_05460 [Candidatus Woesearchaeota archaeon]|nr:hypothetical protein [Candidatus Woesearchaeota archaeon]